MPFNGMLRLAWVLLPALMFTACGRHKLRSDEVERNRLFAEIAAREDRRDPGKDGFLEALCADDGGPTVQRWAVIALGRIGLPASLPSLYRAGRSVNAETRAAAAFAIGEIEDRDLRAQEGRAPDARAAGVLLELLTDTSVGVRGRAVEGLGKAGAPHHVPAIVAAVQRTQATADPSRRTIVEFAITAIMRLKGPEAESYLALVTKDPDPQLQWQALNALVRLGARPACEASLRLISSPDLYVRSYAARGLAACGDAAVTRQLLPLVPPVDPRTGVVNPLPLRVCALQSIAKVPPPGAAEVIESALASPPPDPSHPDQVNFAAQAAAALGAIDTAHSETVLSSLLRWKGAVADSAIVALGRRLKSSPHRFMELLDRSEFSSPAGVRAVAQALGELGGESAAAALRSILIRAAQGDPQSPESAAIPAALSSLGKVRPDDLPSILAPYLASHDPVILRSAVEAYLPIAPSREPWKPIAAAYLNLEGAVDPETKVALLNALESWAGEADVRRTLETALKDRCRNARIAAARLLRLGGGVGVPESPGPAAARTGSAVYSMLAGARQERTVAIVETSRGNIEIQLFREEAPATVDNFCTLAKRGYFDGLTFMRVVPFFVIQGGDPRNDMEGGPGYSIRCEVNMRPFDRGSVGMALAGKDTGGSQFFITLAPQPHLDGGYTCFGRVIAGMAVADQMTPGDRIVRVRLEEARALLDFRRY